MRNLDARMTVQETADIGGHEERLLLLFRVENVAECLGSLVLHADCIEHRACNDGMTECIRMNVILEIVGVNPRIVAETGVHIGNQDVVQLGKRLVDGRKLTLDVVRDRDVLTGIILAAKHGVCTLKRIINSLEHNLRAAVALAERAVDELQVIQRGIARRTQHTGQLEHIVRRFLLSLCRKLLRKCRDGIQIGTGILFDKFLGNLEKVVCTDRNHNEFSICNLVLICIVLDEGQQVRGCPAGDGTVRQRGRARRVLHIVLEAVFRRFHAEACRDAVAQHENIIACIRSRRRDSRQHRARRHSGKHRRSKTSCSFCFQHNLLLSVSETGEKFHADISVPYSLPHSAYFVNAFLPGKRRKRHIFAPLPLLFVVL